MVQADVHMRSVMELHEEQVEDGRHPLHERTHEAHPPFTFSSSSSFSSLPLQTCDADCKRAALASRRWAALLLVLANVAQ
jgi:hypothetical protein